MNIDAVNFFRRNRGNRPSHRSADNFFVQPVALAGGQALGVGETVDAPMGVKDDRPGHYRPGQTSPSHLIDSCDVHESVAPERVLDRATRRDLAH